jgi:hypothetical protein
MEKNESEDLTPKQIIDGVTNPACKQEFLDIRRTFGCDITPQFCKVYCEIDNLKDQIHELERRISLLDGTLIKQHNDGTKPKKE